MGWAPIDFLKDQKKKNTFDSKLDKFRQGERQANPVRTAPAALLSKAAMNLNLANTQKIRDQALVPTIAGNNRGSVSAAVSSGASGAVGTPVPTDIPVEETAPVAPTEVKPYIPDFGGIYGKAAETAAKYRGESLGQFDKMIREITARYAEAENDQNDMWRDSNNELAAMQQGLGITNGSRAVLDRTNTLQRIEENNDAALAGNVSFFERMKALQGQQNASSYDQIVSSGANAEAAYMEALRAQAAEAQAAEAARQQELEDWMFKENYKAMMSGGGGGGGGGGRRGGGGSGSGSVTEKATLTEDLMNTQSEAVYQSLYQINPELAAAYERITNLAAGDPQSAVKIGQEEFDAAASWKGPNIPNAWGFKPIKAQLNRVTPNIRAKKSQSAKDVLNALKIGSGIFGNPTSMTRMTGTSSRKT